MASDSKFSNLTGPSLKAKVMKIRNRLDELFRSRVILAPGDKEGGLYINHVSVR